MIVTDNASSMIKAFKIVQQNASASIDQTIKDVIDAHIEDYQDDSLESVNSDSEISQNTVLENNLPQQTQQRQIGSQARLNEIDGHNVDYENDHHSESVNYLDGEEENLTEVGIENEEYEYEQNGNQIDIELRINTGNLSNQVTKRKSLQLRRMACLSHSLQLVMGHFDKYRHSSRPSSVPRFATAIKEAKKLVCKFNKSTVATPMLMEIAGKKLIGDVSTRWSSTYLLLDRLIQLKSQVMAICEELSWNCLLNSEWTTITSVIKLLEPFASYTQLISADKTPTLSAVIPTIEKLRLHLMQQVKCYCLIKITHLLEFINNYISFTELSCGSKRNFGIFAPRIESTI